MATHLPDPKRIVVGPWAHTYPHIARPGPQIGFLQDAVRWWDCHLKGVDDGISNEPGIHLWVRDPATPKVDYDHRPGRWVSLDKWPSPVVSTRSFFLGDGCLDPSQKADGLLSVASPLGSSATGGEWLPHGVGPEMPGDQRLEDVGTLVFDSPVMDASMDLCGSAKLEAVLASDQPTAQIYVRLSQVNPAGESTRMTHGLLNLSFRDGFGEPHRLNPGEFYRVCVELIDFAEHVPVGHRLRLSIGTQAWPLAWPVADNSTLTFRLRECRLHLPVLSESAEQLVGFNVPKTPPPLTLNWHNSISRKREVVHDFDSGRITRRYKKDDGDFTIEEHGMRLATTAEQSYSVVKGDPCSAEGNVEFVIRNQRSDWQTEVDCKTTMHADAENFYIELRLTIREDGRILKTRTERESIKRVSA